MVSKLILQILQAINTEVSFNLISADLDGYFNAKTVQTFQNIPKSDAYKISERIIYIDKYN